MSPTYSLSEIQRLMKEGSYLITERSQLEAFDLFRFTESKIVGEVLKLKTSDFKKTMPALKKPGLFQDVYMKSIGEKKAYIKLQIANENAVVISFHEYS